MARILVIDDEPGILNVLKVMLGVDGHTVITLQDGSLVEGALHEQDFDLLISDIHMTPVDGMSVLRYVRDQRPDLPVIMLTAYGQVDTAIESMQLGAFDYVKKPFKVDQLLAVVKKALQSAGTDPG
ncbi:MAG: hypothetical protein A2498_07920 [Lentisphaerae bacterium RIFOXYC12_FULL_60_16]|nr:MAG: hypothetical protein A2498_07920 [Lentisphaerae bacterium RIFOXYC12_FULL_60_16]OGV72126.1 MAG: hypothetical protein A2269_05910 [Lentisphaerae bacterium RIFOXYA12_FULL_60_10]OGV77012.1 MAG: hypothetical protein A2340_15625 [Lentisphaerae bacterium RIFOXYB12_FULL_60_10]